MVVRSLEQLLLACNAAGPALCRHVQTQRGRQADKQRQAERMESSLIPPSVPALALSFPFLSVSRTDAYCGVALSHDALREFANPFQNSPAHAGFTTKLS